MEARYVVLSKYAREIAHMRAQLEVQRFGLVFGAGASQEFGFLSWGALVDALAKHPKVLAETLISNISSITTKSQLLFQNFKNSVLAASALEPLAWAERNAHVLSGWRDVLREVLYKNVPQDIAALKARD